HLAQRLLAAACGDDVLTELRQDRVQDEELVGQVVHEQDIGAIRRSVAVIQRGMISNSRFPACGLAAAPRHPLTRKREDKTYRCSQARRTASSCWVSTGLDR